MWTDLVKFHDFDSILKGIYFCVKFGKFLMKLSKFLALWKAKYWTNNLEILPLCSLMTNIFSDPSITSTLCFFNVGTSEELEKWFGNIIIGKLLHCWCVYEKVAKAAKRRIHKILKTFWCILMHFDSTQFFEFAPLQICSTLKLYKLELRDLILM